MSVAALAKASGLHRSLLYRIEGGERRCTGDTALRLAPLLGCKPADLLDTPVNYALARGQRK